MAPRTHRTLAFLTAAALLASAPAFAAKGKSDEPGTPVTVVVIDDTGAPVQTATIRHAEEADPHRVNTTTGAWTASVLYMPDGRELIFEKDMQLVLEISASGYINQEVVYTVKKRKNQFTVTLQKMNFDVDDQEFDDPVIQFGRDRPIDGAGTDPAQ